MNLLIMLLLAFAAQAHVSKPCEEALLLAKPIPRTVMPLYPIEMDAAGQIIGFKDRIPRLETGFYIYLITAGGETLLAPKYDLQDSKKNLATHKSLLEMYKRSNGTAEDPVIVAGGEFQMAFDQTVAIGNRSGNFRGDPQSLRLAVNILTLQGLPISRGTKISSVRVGEVEDDGHAPQDRNLDSFRIQILKDVAGSERGRALKSAYHRFYHLLRETFPRVGTHEALEKLMTAEAVGAGMSGKYDGYQAFYYPLQTAFTADGLEYGIFASESLPDHGGRDGFGAGVPRQFKNFLVGAYDEMTDAQRKKWRRLAREFTALEKLKN
ncbi:MAG: hypothetical protein ACXVA9_02665 [Bdellovibrionales bacterium]